MYQKEGTLLSSFFFGHLTQLEAASLCYFALSTWTHQQLQPHNQVFRGPQCGLQTAATEKDLKRWRRFTASNANAL